MKLSTIVSILSHTDGVDLDKICNDLSRQCAVLVQEAKFVGKAAEGEGIKGAIHAATKAGKLYEQAEQVGRLHAAIERHLTKLNKG